jgi:hypothetical protein
MTGGAFMNLEAVLETYASYERRALVFYRKLSDRFADQAEVSRLWREMSDAEAGHFVVFTLSLDRVTMAGGTKSIPHEPHHEIDAATLDTFSQEMAVLERAAEETALTAQQAAELAVAWEERELSRILALFPALPEQVKGSVRSDILGELSQHYETLTRLVNKMERGELSKRVEALKAKVLAATQ